MTAEQRFRMDQLIWRLKFELRDKREQVLTLAVDIDYLTVQIEQLHQLMGYDPEAT